MIQKVNLKWLIFKPSVYKISMWRFMCIVICKHVIVSHHECIILRKSSYVSAFHTSVCSSIRFIHMFLSKKTKLVFHNKNRHCFCPSNSFKIVLLEENSWEIAFSFIAPWKADVYMYRMKVMIRKYVLI